MATPKTHAKSAAKSAQPAQPPTAGEEKAFADRIAESARPRNPNDPRTPPVANVPPVTSEPIVVAPQGPSAVLPRDARFPRIRSVSFHEPQHFDHASMPVRGINMASAWAAEQYRRLEFTEFFGRLSLLIERKDANSPNGYAIHRMPFEALSLFTTYDDNPLAKPIEISVNEKAAPAGRS